MTTPDDVPRTDPPLAADELATLRGFVDFYRATIRRQCAGLTTEQLRTRHAPSTLTLAGMLKHLAYVETYWFRVVLHGLDQGAPWTTVDWRADGDWDWNSALEDDPADLTALFDAAVRDSDARLDEALADGDLDSLAATARRGERVNLRWILVHMVEEYARHAGHADLIRESLDGATDL